MSQPYRLAKGGVINRRRPMEFSFNKRSYQGYQGDTVASALLANGIHLVARSFKYHRPRGIYGAGAEEPNALLQIGSGARALPNQRATQIELYDGLEASSVNAWPSVEFDLRAANGLIGKALPAGFYYKTFISKWLWRRAEPHIRKAAGFGTTPEYADPDLYDKMNAHCDVLIAGGGAAGLAAALAAGRAGCRVILADEQNEFGGRLLSQLQMIDNRSTRDWVTQTLRELATMPEVRLLPRTTVFGYYDHNFLAAVERRGDHLPPALAADQGARQRLWRIRAKQVVLATGAIERPLVFGNNDCPGVMLASAVSTYINRYAVTPGKRAVVFTNNDSAYQTVLDMHAAKIDLAAVIDVRPNPQGVLAEQVRALGIEISAGHAVAEVQGGKHIEGVRVLPALENRSHITDTPRGIACDLLAVSGGWNPALHLHSQSGGRNRWDEALTCFVPDKVVQAEQSVGSCNGTFALQACLSQAYQAGLDVARQLGFNNNGLESSYQPEVYEASEEALRPLWLIVDKRPSGRGAKQFVDLQNDTTAADILLAAREGFHSIEHVKRYTALGFGTDQGKIGNINGMAILAKALGKSIPEVGTTTFRPAYTPVTFGAIAGRDVGELLDPVRKTAMHHWHEEQGALFEDVGQWKRPWYYPKSQGQETLHEAVNRECLAVRNSVGIMDASTLGKIDIQGPDATKLLNWVYTNGWDKLAVGRGRYGLMLGEDGMVMDDGVTTRLAENHYLMTTTTGNATSVLDWLERWLQTEWPEMQVYLNSVTDHWATLSLNGPNSRALLSKLCDDIDFADFPFMSYRDGMVAGVKARIMRISFSGELSYEVNVPANYGRYVWEAFITAGEEFEITPYGTEAMHVLRAEKGFIIVGQETDGAVTPLDLGMQWIISDKKEFLGKRSLQRPEMQRDDRKQLVGLLSRNPQQVLPEGGQIINTANDYDTPVAMQGHVTSSYYSACLGRSIALALVKGGRQRIGERIFVASADMPPLAAEIVQPMFYDAEGARQHV